MTFTIPKPPTPKPSTRHHTNQPTPSDTAHSIDMCLDILSQSPRDACGENRLMDGSLDEKDSTPLRPSSSTIYNQRNWVSKSKSKSCLLFFPSSRHLFGTLFCFRCGFFGGWGWCDWYTLRIMTAMIKGLFPCALFLQTFTHPKELHFLEGTISSATKTPPTSSTQTKLPSGPFPF